MDSQFKALCNSLDSRGCVSQVQRLGAQDPYLLDTQPDSIKRHGLKTEMTIARNG